METTPQVRFDYQRLDVYWAAVTFRRWHRVLLRRLPPGNGDLRDQIRRAVNSIVLNIAEASGEFSGPDRARFNRFARRSAVECASVLDLLEDDGLFRADALEEGRTLLDRIMAMLTVMGSLRTPAKHEGRR